MLPIILVGIAAWFLYLPFALLVSIPFGVFCGCRLLVTQILRRIFRNDLEPIVHPDFIFSTDEFYTDPRGAIGFVHVLNKPVKLEFILERLSNILSSDTSNYARLTSLHPIFWLGYPFWMKLSTEFDLSKHVKSVAHVQGKDEILTDWFLSPFQRHRPLWDAILISSKLKS